jgi:hypothetical protein
VVSQAIILKTGVDYDERGIIENSVGGELARAWRERFFHANAARTTGESAALQELPDVGDASVPGGGEGRGKRGPPARGTPEDIYGNPVLSPEERAEEERQEEESAN